jgi:hypothetical protein
MKAIETDHPTSEPLQQEVLSLVDFPVHDLGPWPEDLSLRRADLYGDDER